VFVFRDIAIDGARCYGGDDVSALRNRKLEGYVGERNSGGWVSEQPASQDEWESIVEYNEKMLYATETASRCRQVERVDTQPATFLRSVPRRVDRKNVKPPTSPKPTCLSQQVPKRVLPVQQFLHRQVLLYGGHCGMRCSDAVKNRHKTTPP